MLLLGVWLIAVEMKIGTAKSMHLHKCFATISSHECNKYNVCLHYVVVSLGVLVYLAAVVIFTVLSLYCGPSVGL